MPGNPGAPRHVRAALQQLKEIAECPRFGRFRPVPCWTDEERAVAHEPQKHKPFVPEHVEMREFTIGTVVLGLVMTVRALPKVI